MTNIGAEVGQKMRSAIKAKLLELNCYVDDELPDYVMVMVANKRTKSQMKEDLQLFLTTKTGTFVDWLHIVLKKLKEVTVTNPEVYKKNSKRKITEVSDVNVKKERKDKKADKKDKQDKTEESPSFTSLTDDLPINANKLAEQRKIIIMKENQSNNSEVLQDTFDIPLLSEVNMSTEAELEDIERKIRSVKSRLGLLVESDDETAGGDSISLKAEPEDVPADGRDKSPEKPLETDDRTPPRRIEHSRITFTDKNEPETRSSSPPPPSKPKSILERLGKRKEASIEEEPKPKKNRISLSEFRKDEEKLSHGRDKTNKEDRKSRRSKQSEPAKVKENILSRLGVQSKVSVPLKDDPAKNREVPSVIKIKPRVIPADAPQANKNLLLKAVAEAQRSIAQTPVVGSGLKSDALFTKRYKEKRGANQQPQQQKKGSHRLSDSEKNKIKKILSTQDGKEESLEYVPTPLRKSQDLVGVPKYIPSSTKTHHQNDHVETDDSSTSPPPPSPAAEPNPIKQQFIVTLDGLSKTKFSTATAAAVAAADGTTITTSITTKTVERHHQLPLDETKEDSAKEKPSIKSRLDRKRSPSPIIFDMTSSPVKTKSNNIPDKLPIVHTPSSVKNKERCKYWPACRQGEKCEFVHPTGNCDKFPHCKFGDKCLYIHPVCKFASSCTRRDCPYSHGNKSASRLASTTAVKLSTQCCKFFPSCSNPNCPFLHPKPCKFGKFCKNQRDCTFSHPFVPKKSSLTWRSQ